MGKFHQMLTELREGDREYYFRYMRMRQERFDHLLSLVEDKIEANKTLGFSHFALNIPRYHFIFSENNEISDKILSLISKLFDISDNRYRSKHAQN